MLEFIEVTHTGKALDYEIIQQLLSLAHEYDCKSVLQRCEDFLLKTLVSFHVFLLASKYDLKQLEEKCINELLLHDSHHMTHTSYGQLDSDAKVKYLERKLARCEGELTRLNIAEKRVADVERCLNTSLTNVICCDAELYKIRTKANAQYWSSGSKIMMETTLQDQFQMPVNGAWALYIGHYKICFMPVKREPPRKF